MKKSFFVLFASLLLMACPAPKPEFSRVLGEWNSYPSDLVSNLTIEKEKTTFEFGCGGAEISEELFIKEGVNNAYKGIFTQGRPVIPANYNPKDDQKEVRITFTYINNELNARIVDFKTGIELGNFDYRRGGNKNIPKCL